MYELFVYYVVMNIKNVYISTELGYPRLDTRRLADTDADRAADIPADKMLRQEATPAEEHHCTEGKYTETVHVAW